MQISNEADDDEGIVVLTRRGRQALKAGLDGLSLDSMLLIEILGQVQQADATNVADLADELVQHYGSHENAIVAIKFGRVQFEKIEQEGHHGKGK